MANNTPVGNLDFTSPLEALNALQRNPQVARLSLSGVLTATFTGSTMYGYIIDSGSVTLNATSSGGAFLLKMTGPSAQSFPFGAPLAAPPPGGAVVATVSSSAVNATLFFK